MRPSHIAGAAALLLLMLLAVRSVQRSDAAAAAAAGPAPAAAFAWPEVSAAANCAPCPAPAPCDAAPGQPAPPAAQCPPLAACPPPPAAAQCPPPAACPPPPPPTTSEPPPLFGARPQGECPVPRKAQLQNHGWLSSHDNPQSSLCLLSDSVLRDCVVQLGLEKEVDFLEYESTVEKSDAARVERKPMECDAVLTSLHLHNYRVRAPLHAKQQGARQELDRFGPLFERVGADRIVYVPHDAQIDQMLKNEAMQTSAENFIFYAETNAFMQKRLGLERDLISRAAVEKAMYMSLFGPQWYNDRLHFNHCGCCALLDDQAMLAPLGHGFGEKVAAACSGSS